MKKYCLLLVLAISACSIEEMPVPETDSRECRYVTVGVNLGQDEEETKSVIAQSAESFKSAVLYAMNPSSGNILTYGDNAGSLSGTPLYINTQSKSFAWPLPEATPMRIYCIINPPSEFLSGIIPTSLTERALTSKLFVCDGPDALQNLSTGLPKSGVMDVDENQITGDDASLTIPVKNLFSKYRFSLDLSDLESGEKLVVNKMSVCNGNTSLPYFTEGFGQGNSQLLKDFDYATSAQLTVLSKGGQAHGVDIYVLENCQGKRSGARSWWTVYSDLYSTWPQISSCTNILLSYTITDAQGYIHSCASRIYLGSGNMVDDFNVRRNQYQNIVIKANRRTGESDPYFLFSSDTYFFAPGNVNTARYGSNIYQVSLGGTTPEVWVTETVGAPSSDFTVVSHDPSAGTVELRASSNCEEGKEYWLYGGVRSQFYWPPYGSDAQSFTERRKIIMVPSRTLTFDAPYAEIYPYMEADYISRERYSLSVAQEVAATVRLTAVSDSVDPSLTSVSVTEINGEYAIKVTLVPSKPGEISFSATYGESDDTATGPSLTVQTPVLKPFGDMHVDVKGTRTNIVWMLMDRNCNLRLPSPVRSGSFRVAKKDPYGTELNLTTTADASANTSCTSTLYIAGFGGLPGFDPDNYSFDGADIPIEASYIYPGGYTVSTTVNFHLDNPLSEFSYDGDTYDYCVLQGKTLQPDYVTVTEENYKVENLLQWPQRQFTVDLSRGGRRACSGLSVWTEYSGITSPDSFAPNGSKVYIDEDLSLWGPLYYGRIVSNSESGETVKFVHSIIRVYSHYNVFAKFDVQEKNHVRIDWDDQGNINWSPIMIFNYHFGSFQVRTASNMDRSANAEAIASLISTDITSSTRVKPILDGFSLYSRSLVGHSTYSEGLHNTYQVYKGEYYNNTKSYVLGYYERPSEPGYDINYDWIYIDGVDNNVDRIYWRLIATCNKPWFKIRTGGTTVNGVYLTRVQKNAAGDYCFNALASSQNQSFYLDHEGLGYLRICPWWEGKEGKVMIRSTDLHPLTAFDAGLCIVNGWYDPTPYDGGIPKLKEKVGMYFFPESASSSTRSGYAAYYSPDGPYLDSAESGYMEITTFSHLSFGDLYQRDITAAR